ncbi:MAG: hypothetical protein AB7D27_03955 [Desulfomicrobium sp.]
MKIRSLPPGPLRVQRPEARSGIPNLLHNCIQFIENADEILNLRCQALDIARLGEGFELRAFSAGLLAERFAAPPLRAWKNMATSSLFPASRTSRTFRSTAALNSRNRNNSLNQYLPVPTESPQRLADIKWRGLNRHKSPTKMGCHQLFQAMPGGKSRAIPVNAAKATRQGLEESRLFHGLGQKIE